MGFVKRRLDVEELLESIGVRWRPMTDSQYQGVTGILRRLVDEEAPVSTGHSAVAYVEGHAAQVRWIFNVPNFAGLPVTPERHEPTYGYAVKGLPSIPRAELNRYEAILAGDDLAFICVFNHEWDSFAPEQLYAGRAGAAVVA